MLWVMCHPFLEERIFSQRVVLRFALALAQAGHAALRFDYEGEGESDEEGGSVAVSGFVSDTACTVEFLRGIYPGARVGLMGLRGGAWVAAMAAGACEAAGLLLWAPLLEGKAYIDECLRANLVTQLATYSKVIEPREALLQKLHSGGRVDLQGCEVSSAWVDSVMDLSLRRVLADVSCPVTMLHLSKHGKDTVPSAWDSLLDSSRVTAEVCRCLPFWGETKVYEEAPSALFETSLRAVQAIAQPAATRPHSAQEGS